MATAGVHTVQAGPTGLAAEAFHGEVTVTVNVDWDDVPYDVRQHLAEVYRYLNEVTDARVRGAATLVREKIIHQSDASWISEAV